MPVTCISSDTLRRPPGFRSGFAYLGMLGRPGCFAEEAALVLALLRLMAREPLAVTLLPPSQERVPALLDGGEPIGPAAEASLTLFTSGTTGVPKPVVRRLAGEVERRQGRGKAEDVWLLTYAPFRWAGISVLLHALANRCAVVVPEGETPGHLAAALEEGRVTHLSLTPSLFRKMQVAGLSKQIGAANIRQITFGGEAADQPVLDAARSLAPAARVSHVYATTELGDVMAVSDGLAGLPAARMEGNARFGFTEDGELLVGGLPTGDLWAREGARYTFRGRRQEIINVGGLKLSPAEIERHALAVPGVLWARVFGVPSPVLGQVVGLEFVGSCDAAELRQALRRALPKPAVPVAIEQLQDVALSSANKTIRRMPPT